MEEPKYKIQVRTSERKTQFEVSTAQVQFWPEYADLFKARLGNNRVDGEYELNDPFENEEAIAALKSFGREVSRVDLLTNEYHPDFICRLDK